MINSGCTHTGDVADHIASESNFDRKVVAGSAFDHVVYESNLQMAGDGVLKVYIEGDGIPWQRGRVPATDPTPRKPIALQMMAQDSSAAIYIGRPCYFGMVDSRNCDPNVWTFARYSEAAVASMKSVIRQYENSLGITRLVLIGYSGGGAIAALIARDMNVPVYLLTIAANLDTDAWTAAKGFLPLDDSLNPVDFLDQLIDIQQLHMIGAGDSIVPPDVTRSYTDNFPPASSKIYSGFDHVCCWVEEWPRILLESPWSGSIQP